MGREKTTTFSVCPSSHPSFPKQACLSTFCSPLPILCLPPFSHGSCEIWLIIQPTKWQWPGLCSHQSCLKHIPSAPPSTLPQGYIVHKESKQPGVAHSQLIFAVHNKLRNPPFVDGKMLILPNCMALLYHYCRLKIKACLT